MDLVENEIHIWLVSLALDENSLANRFNQLSADEQERALRFRAPIHQKRFIAARSQLREILARYLEIKPNVITFNYNEHGKPRLSEHILSPIQFNLAHSDAWAACAVTKDFAIGIDIEKVQEKDNKPILDRYFTKQEANELMQLPEADQSTAFYRLWARKEAVIKAIGQGLAHYLSAFSVSSQDKFELIKLQDQTWSLASLSLHEDFAAAVATNQPIKKITIWHLFDHDATLVSQGKA